MFFIPLRRFLIIHTKIGIRITRYIWKIMDREQIENKVKEIVIDYFDLDEIVISAESNIVQTLELNSLTRMELVVLIAQHLGVKIPFGDFATIVTFSDLYDYIQNHQLAE